jgi:tetratricopeptide (TPR) repeat protein
LRQAVNKEKDSLRKAVLQADALSLLEEAYDATDQSSVIALELAKQRDQLGTPEESMEILRIALEKDPTNSRLRDLWIRFKIERNEWQEALEIALEGTKYDPTSWRLQRHIARIKRATGGSIEAIKGHYEAAIRHHKGDLALLVELGAYLFTHGKYSEANIIFSQARDLPTNYFERQKIREIWEDADRKPVIFSGKVKSIGGAAAWAIAIPDNFEAFFWRNRTNLSDLQIGTQINFSVGFNAHGATALFSDFAN